MMEIQAKIDDFVKEHSKDFVEQISNLSNEILSEQILSDVKFVYISFMRSSILNDLPWFKLDFYNDDILKVDEVFSAYFESKDLLLLVDDILPIPEETPFRDTAKKNMLNYNTEKYKISILIHNLLTQSLKNQNFNTTNETAPSVDFYYGDYLANYFKI